MGKGGRNILKHNNQNGLIVFETCVFLQAQKAVTRFSLGPGGSAFPQHCIPVATKQHKTEFRKAISNERQRREKGVVAQVPTLCPRLLAEAGGLMSPMPRVQEAQDHSSQEFHLRLAWKSAAHPDVCSGGLAALPSPLPE